MTETVVRPVRGSMPRVYREIVNTLIDQGWQYIPSEKGSKHKIIPPDPTKPQLSVASTPGRGSLIVFLTKVRRCGGVLDEQALERIARRDSERRLRQAMRDSGLLAQQPPETDPTIQPVSTKGAFWRPAEPEPEPEPKVRVLAPPSPDDACGTAWTLGQARNLIRQGYHILKVTRKTGWGANHLRDLVDSTGYYHLQEGTR